MNNRPLIHCCQLQNGLIPNGIIVNNTNIQSQTLEFLKFVIENQDSTGWLGPEVFDISKPRYLWGRLSLARIKRRGTNSFVFSDTPSFSVQCRCLNMILRWQTGSSNPFTSSFHSPTAC